MTAQIHRIQSNEWDSKNAANNLIKPLIWPPNCLHCNPMENVWIILKQTMSFEGSQTPWNYKNFGDC